MTSTPKNKATLKNQPDNPNNLEIGCRVRITRDMAWLGAEDISNRTTIPAGSIGTLHRQIDGQYHITFDGYHVSPDIPIFRLDPADWQDVQKANQHYKKPKDWNVGTRLRIIADDVDKRNWSAGLVPQGAVGTLQYSFEFGIFHVVYDDYPDENNLVRGICGSWGDYEPANSPAQTNQSPTRELRARPKPKPESWDIGTRLMLTAINPKSRNWKAGKIPYGAIGTLLFDKRTGYYIVFDEYPAQNEHKFGLSNYSWGNFTPLDSKTLTSKVENPSQRPTCEKCKWFNLTDDGIGDCCLEPDQAVRCCTDIACKHYSYWDDGTDL